MSKILLIRKDNDPDYKRLPDIFAKLGYDTICTETASDALQHVSSPDVYGIFFDIDAVPDCSEFSSIIQAAKPYTMLVVTGSDSNADIICRAIDLGAYDYIHKPFNFNIFEARTRNIFTRYNEIKHFHNTSLELFLDTIPSMIAITDDTRHILYANAAFCNKYGVKKETTFDKMLCEVIGCNDFNNDIAISLHHHCGKCKLYEYGQDLFAKDKRITRKKFSYTQMSDGRLHDKSMRVSMTPMYNGQRRSAIVTLDDITFEQTAINEFTATICALRQSNNNTEEEMKKNRDLAQYLQKINNSLQSEITKRQLLVDNMTSGFLLVEYKDKKLYLRKANAKLSELTKRDLTKRYGNILTEQHELYPSAFYNALLNVAETEKSISFNASLPDRSTDFHVNMYMPEPGFVAAIINDTTEETKNLRENKERAKQLQRLNVMLDDRNKELQKAIDTKNKFISIIAHDLRNPLNAINGLSELLSKRLKPEDDQRSHNMATILHQSAKSACELLNNLLVWARSQQNTIQFNPEQLNVYTITNETINEIRVQAERKHITLINSTDPGDTVWADKPMLQTIIRNLVSNAIKFTNEGGLIVVASSQDDSNIAITIEDNGVGMTQETINKLTSSSELNSTKGTSGETGTGMGLIISKEFIQRHHGTLNIESTLGKGSTFTIKLPYDTQTNN